MNQKDERTWGALVHLGGIIGMAIFSNVGNIIGVLILWLIKRNESTFVDRQGKEALNFQITLSFVTLAISIISSIQSGIWSFTRLFWHSGSIFTENFIWHTTVNVAAYRIIWLINIIFSIIAAMRANNGVAYRYPVSWRIVK